MADLTRKRGGIFAKRAMSTLNLRTWPESVRHIMQYIEYQVITSDAYLPSHTIRTVNAIHQKRVNPMLPL